MTAGERYNWKWLLFCISLIAVNIMLIREYYPQSGWDFQIYRSAVRAWEHGSNPYLVANLREFGNYFKDYPFIYIPISLYFFRIFCFGNSLINYYIFWSLLLAGSYLVIRMTDRPLKSLYLVTLLMTAFYATLCNFWSGNIGLVEMFILALVLYCAAKGRYYISAVFLGLLSTLKVVPLIFAPLFFFSDISKPARIRAVGLVLALFVSISLLSYMLFPEITQYYYLSIEGKIPNQEHAVSEEGNQANPAPFFFIRGIARYLYNDSMVMFFILYGLFVYLLFAPFRDYIRRKRRDFLRIFCLGIIPIMLILPRLKSYSFVLVIPPVYFLTKDLDMKRRFWTLLVVSVGPLALWQVDKVVCRIPALYVVQRMLDYRQAIFLVLFYVLFLVNDYLAERSNRIPAKV